MFGMNVYGYVREFIGSFVLNIIIYIVYVLVYILTHYLSPSSNSVIELPGKAYIMAITLVLTVLISIASTKPRQALIPTIIVSFLGWLLSSAIFITMTQTLT